MKGAPVGEKLRWKSEEKELLRKLHLEAAAERRSQLFIDKLAANFPHRSVASVAEECRRLKLPVKRNPKSENCVESDCGAVLTEDRVGDNCRRCYMKNWHKERARLDLIASESM